MDETINMQQFVGASGFGFSSVNPNDLGSTEYTLVTIAIDASGSVSGYKDMIVKTVQQIVDACKLNPRIENLMLRLVKFGSRVDEVMGFMPLSLVDVSNFDHHCGGMTALVDATFHSIDATEKYATTLVNADMDTNGIVFIITDGEENCSCKSNVGEIKASLQKIRTSETSSLESIIAILIGLVPPASQTNQVLDSFKANADIDKYLCVGDATPETLARLAAFISKSISSQSQSLGSGASAPVNSFVF